MSAKAKKGRLDQTAGGRSVAQTCLKTRQSVAQPPGRWCFCSADICGQHGR